MRLKSRYLAYFIFLFLLNISLHAQDNLFLRYADYRGLYSRVNYKISQDVNGYILLGTDNGLYTYDGTSFEKLGKGTEIENKEILEATPLNNGDIFVSSYYSNNVYVLRDNKGTKHNQPFLKKYYFENSNQYEINAVDKANSVVYFTRREAGENRFLRYSKGKISEIKIPFGRIEYFDYSTGNIYLSMIDKSNIETKYLFQYNIHTHKRKVFNFDQKKYGNFIARGENCILTWKDNIVYYFDYIKGEIKLNSKLNFNHRLESINLTIDSRGNVWVYNLIRGAWYYNLANKKNGIVEPRKFLQDETINHLFIDKDKNAWLSSKNNGVFYLPSRLYEQYITQNKEPFLEYVSSIKGYNNKLYLGIQNSGFAIYDNQNKITKQNFDKDIDETRDLLVYKDQVFVSDYKGPFFQYNLKTKKVKESPWVFVKSIYPFTKDDILITNFLGAHRYNIKTGEYSKISKLKSYTAIPFHKDSIFNGNFKDLYKVNINNQTETLFLKEMYFNEIVPLSKDLYAGASNTKGVIIFNRNKIIKVINTSNGLKDNQILSLNVEDKNMIWASSTQGLYRITLSPTIQIRNFSVADGLFSNIVNASFTKGDSIYIGTKNGLNAFKIDNLLNDQELSTKKPFIHAIEINNTIYQNKDSIVTTYHDNTVRIRMSFLDYASMGRVRYKYRMTGVNDNWTISSNNTIAYSSLNPGTYRFEVYGISASNLESKEFASFLLIVKPLFWQTWWFRIFTVLLLVGLGIFLFWAYRENRLRGIKYDQKISELELQAIKSQINPHFIYNCLNSIQYLIYKKSFDDADRYLAVFSKMVRSTLHYSERTFLPIDDEVEYIKIYLEMEKMRFKDNFTFDIIVEPEVDRSRLVPTLLLQPYVENALKHGISSIDRPGRIEITFYQNEDGVGINIFDNGSGYNPKHNTDEGGHLGLKLSEKRIETYNTLFKTDISMSLSTEKDHFTLIQIFINNEK